MSDPWEQIDRYEGEEFESKFEQLMRYVRGDDSQKLPKKDFRILIESILSRMIDLSEGSAMVDMENDRLRAEVQSLKSQIEFGDAMNDVAVKERNYERVLNMRLQTENAELRDWKTAILDQLVTQWTLRAEHETDPKKAIHDMLSWEVMVALDPLVSRDAEALIERGREEMRAQIAAHETVCAGVWVKVGERDPKKGLHWTTCVVDWDGSSAQCETWFDGLSWLTSNDARVTHWLDARMPGEDE